MQKVIMQKFKIIRFLLIFQIMVCCFGMIAGDRSKEAAFINDIFAGKGYGACALVHDFNLATKHPEQSRFFPQKKEEILVIDLTKISSDQLCQKKQKPKFFIPKSPATVAALAISPEAVTVLPKSPLFKEHKEHSVTPTKQMKKAEEKAQKAGKNRFLEEAIQKAQKERVDRNRAFMQDLAGGDNPRLAAENLKRAHDMIFQINRSFSCNSSLPAINAELKTYIQTGGIVVYPMVDIFTNSKKFIVQQIVRAKKDFQSAIVLQKMLVDVNEILKTLKTGRYVDCK